MSTCRGMNKQVFLVSPLGQTHALFDYHVFMIMSIGNSDNIVSRLLGRIIVLNRPNYYKIYYEKLFLGNDIILICNLMKKKP
jgi:hypothetical protein